MPRCWVGSAVTPPPACGVVEDAALTGGVAAAWCQLGCSCGPSARSRWGSDFRQGSSEEVACDLNPGISPSSGVWSDS